MSDERSDNRQTTQFHYHLELTPAQLKITHTALRSLLDDFGHDEPGVIRIIHEILDKLPELGLLLALATAFASVVGFLYKHRGAVESPAVELRRPIRTSLALFRSHWYVLGIVIATASWGLHVAALSLAPISLASANTSKCRA